MGSAQPSDAGDRSFKSAADHDGIPNGLEFALRADGMLSNTSEEYPQSSLTEEGDLIYSFGFQPKTGGFALDN